MSFMINDIVKVYNSYGFEYRPDLSVNEAIVFTIAQGIFDNAIILNLPNNKAPENLKEELIELGFQVKNDNFLSLKKTEDSLFSGFFSIKKTKAAFKKDYDYHIENVINSFPSKNTVYSYMKSPFMKDSHPHQADDNILEHIKNEVASAGPKLILIEAAAGFGKTCTAYEIGRIISEQDDEHIVLFAELSRDRQAKIFNHILHKEVARSFPTVPPDLVIREIKRGKVIVILDGFDELLNEREEEKFQFEKSQAMLETIGKITENNAKVILTTRKTAILEGDDFDEWISSQVGKFEFTRFSLKEPSVRSWLGHERHERLENSRVRIKNLSNPVLLTFLKLIDDEQFDEVIKTPDCIVEKYFDLLLNREIDRQTLQMTVNEQSDFMRRLAQHMMHCNFTRDSKENIVSYFSEYEVDIIETVRARYTSDSRPSFEAMLEKLSNHALFDRSSIDEKIGFINNFVLGHFVAMDLMGACGEWLADSIFVEAAVNAYSSRTVESREEIWKKLGESLNYVSDEERVRLELRLLDRVEGEFSGSSFNEVVFDTGSFFILGSVSSCYFNECTFSNCCFDFSKIQRSAFISCVFYNCTSQCTNLNNEFISPTMDETSKTALIGNSEEIEKPKNTISSGNQVKAYILEKFWPVGKETIAFAHRPMFIFYRGGAYPSHVISDAIDELRRDRFIVPAKRKNWVGLELSGPNFMAVKEILGR